MPLTFPQLFIQERQYLKNVSRTTLIWYQTAFSVFEDCGLEDLSHQPPQAVLAKLKDRVMHLQASKRVKPISINSWLRVVNAYLRWAHQEGYLAEPLRIPKLKAPEAVIEPWSPEQVRSLVTYKARLFSKQRVQAMALLIADTGLRVSEALALRRDDVDFDAMLVHVRCGKGGKVRVVPMSVVGRKILFKWLSTHDSDLVFCTREGLPWQNRNALRSFKLLCKELGISGVRTSWHTLRHSFAAAYVREGGDVFSLQRMLGHSTLEMTKRYVRLSTADLQAKHQQHARLLMLK